MVVRPEMSALVHTVFDRVLCPTAILEYQMAPFGFFSVVLNRMCHHILLVDVERTLGRVDQDSVAGCLACYYLWFSLAMSRLFFDVFSVQTRQGESSSLVWISN